MKTMAISEFKAHALKVIDQVAKNREKIIITKRGKPVAQVVPFVKDEKKNRPGKLASTLVFEKDIISPLGEKIWDSCK
jgi:prevent-host-death family protein